MSKIFLAYKYTGEDPEELIPTLVRIHDSLVSAGHDVFCQTLSKEAEEQKHWSPDRIYSYCLEQMKHCDLFFPFVRSKTPSLGMELESDNAIELGLPFVLAIKQGLDYPEFREAAHKIIEFSDVDALCSEITSSNPFMDLSK